MECVWQCLCVCDIVMCIIYPARRRVRTDECDGEIELNAINFHTKINVKNAFWYEEL